MMREWGDSRREILEAIGISIGGVLAAFIIVPIVAVYLFLPVVRLWTGYLRWLAS